MPDREKVLKGLDCCTRYEVGKQLNNCLECPYVEQIGFNQFRCKSQEMKEDALALLRQEAVTPTRMNHSEKAGFDNYLCECKNELYYKQKFCDECGRAVKWE